MIIHIKKALEFAIESISEIDISICKNDVDIQKYSEKNNVVSFELHESRKKTTNDFNLIIFVNSYAKTADEAVLLGSLVYDKIEKLVLENEWIKTAQILYENSLADVMYSEDLKLYYQISNYKTSYRRLK